MRASTSRKAYDLVDDVGQREAVFKYLLNQTEGKSQDEIVAAVGISYNSKSRITELYKAGYLIRSENNKTNKYEFKAVKDKVYNPKDFVKMSKSKAPEYKLAERLGMLQIETVRSNITPALKAIVLSNVNETLNKYIENKNLKQLEEGLDSASFLFKLYIDDQEEL